ncbi:MAG: Rossmann-like and DUF2520 domain-containing protein [Saprospiraceae bacterium]|nr:Rossmann-like and DUF2520 domain-containing protein [Saprospiraceae bacterium]
MVKVVCIGAGRLAQQLMPALEEAGCHIMQVYNRTPQAAEALAEKLKGSSYTADLESITREADLYFFTVSDDAITLLSSQIFTLLPEDAIGVHCSGSLGLDVLPFARKAGFYPLQSFSANHEVSWRWIPLIITTLDEDIWEFLDTIAGQLSTSVYRMTEVQKSNLHIAAVFANNFSNHMLTLAESICNEHQLPFEILKPLILETFSKAILSGPQESQTGPAVRGDEKTILKHLALLDHHPQLRNVYRVVTENIRENLK